MTTQKKTRNNPKRPAEVLTKIKQYVEEQFINQQQNSRRAMIEGSSARLFFDSEKK